MDTVDNIFDSMIDDVDYLKKLIVIKCRPVELNKTFLVSNIRTL